MKILRAIPKSKIPPMTPGNGHDKNTRIYDAIAKRAKSLSAKSVLPIECESIDECFNLQHALRIRGCSSVRRRTTVYTSDANE